MIDFCSWKEEEETSKYSAFYVRRAKLKIAIWHSSSSYSYSSSSYSSFYLCKVKSMDDNCGEWVECMGVASGCGEQEVGVASGSGWNLWVWLLGVVLRRYIDFLILLIPTPLVSVLFGSSIPTFFFILLK